MKKAFAAVPKETFTKFFDAPRAEKLNSLIDLTLPDEFKKDADWLSQQIHAADAEIVLTGWGSPPITEKTLDENPQLKYMCHLSGTVRAYITRDIIEKGLLVTNWGSAIGPTVAEASLLGILSCLRNTNEVTFLMHENLGWNSDKNVRSLFYRKVGLHGFGIIAQCLAELLQPFKCDISTYSPHAPDSALEKYNVRRVDSLKDLYAQNTVISVHASNTPDNHHIVNAEILAAMPDNAVLVNTARSAVIDSNALLAELKSGRISASLDVFDNEPLPANSPLRGLRNCQLTPHTGGPTPDRLVDMGDVAIANLENFINGRKVENILTPERYDLIT